MHVVQPKSGGLCIRFISVDISVDRSPYLPGSDACAPNLMVVQSCAVSTVVTPLGGFIQAHNNASSSALAYW